MTLEYLGYNVVVHLYTQFFWSSFIFAEFSHDVVSTKMVTPPEVNFRLVNKHKNHSSKCLIDMMIQVEPVMNATG